MNRTDDGGLTRQDRRVLEAISDGETYTSYRVAEKLGLRTMSPRETGARHLCRLTRLGFAVQIGTRMFPKWAISSEGLSFLSQRSKGRADT